MHIQLLLAFPIHRIMFCAHWFPQDYCHCVENYCTLVTSTPTYACWKASDERCLIVSHAVCESRLKIINSSLFLGLTAHCLFVHEYTNMTPTIHLVL